MLKKTVASFCFLSGFIYVPAQVIEEKQTNANLPVGSEFGYGASYEPVCTIRTGIR